MTVPPLRDVVRSLLMSGRGSVLGPDTSRRTHWWELTLSCDHTVERTARYVPLTDEQRAAGESPRQRRPSSVRPAPRRARCATCGATARRSLDDILG